MRFVVRERWILVIRYQLSEGRIEVASSEKSLIDFGKFVWVVVVSDI